MVSPSSRASAEMKHSRLVLLTQAWSATRTGEHPLTAHRIHPPLIAL